MNKCFQKVPSKEPPRDIYTRLGAFTFYGQINRKKSLPWVHNGVITSRKSNFNRHILEN